LGRPRARPRWATPRPRPATCTDWPHRRAWDLRPARGAPARSLPAGEPPRPPLRRTRSARAASTTSPRSASETGSTNPAKPALCVRSRSVRGDTGGRPSRRPRRPRPAGSARLANRQAATRPARMGLAAPSRRPRRGQPRMAASQRSLRGAGASAADIDTGVQSVATNSACRGCRRAARRGGGKGRRLTAGSDGTRCRTSARKPCPADQHAAPRPPGGLSAATTSWRSRPPQPCWTSRGP
jgi:hypothetical protein